MKVGCTGCWKVFFGIFILGTFWSLYEQYVCMYGQTGIICYIGLSYISQFQGTTEGALIGLLDHTAFLPGSPLGV